MSFGLFALCLLTAPSAGVGEWNSIYLADIYEYILVWQCGQNIVPENNAGPWDIWDRPTRQDLRDRGAVLENTLK